MLRAREIAYGMAKRCCVENDIQLLDDTVRLSSIRIRFVTGVWTLRLQRSFTFEYSRLGTERLAGVVTLLGYRVVGTRLNDGAGSTYTME